MTHGNDSVGREMAGQSYTTGDSGLTKREYFAALAMQGLISNAITIAAMIEIGKESGMSDPAGVAVTARMSVIFADSLIMALNRKEEKNVE